MYKNKKFLCVIPARSGSKGIYNKNLQLINKKPLIFYPVKAAKNSKYIDKIIFTTDSRKYQKLAIAYGAESLFIRSKKLSSDKIKSYDVIIDVINYLKKKLQKFDFVILLEPTSPFTTQKDIDYSIKKLVDLNCNSLLSVTDASKFNILFQFKKFGNQIKPLIKGKNNQRRQEIQKTYVLDGSIYISKISDFIKNRGFVSKKTIGIELPKWKSIEIDDKNDLMISRMIYKINENEIQK